MPNFRLLAAMMIVLAEGLPAALFVSVSAGSIATSGNSADYGNAGKMTAHAAAGGLNTISDSPGAFRPLRCERVLSQQCVHRPDR